MVVTNIIAKLTFAPTVSVEEREKYEKILYGSRDPFLTKISTAKLDVVHDRKDQREIIGLRNLKLTFMPTNENIGSLILMGSLSFSFQTFRPEFFVRKIINDNNLKFDAIKAPECFMEFDPLKKDELEDFQKKLKILRNSENFEFDINQFSEFIEIFEFYKRIANELNNDANFELWDDQFRKYYFVPVGEKNIDLTFAKKIYNEESIITGYEISRSEYKRLSSEEQDKCTEVLDLEIIANKSDLKKIKMFGHNDGLYVSTQEKIKNFDSNLCAQFTLFNSNIETRTIQKKVSKKSKDEFDDEYESVAEEYVILTGSIQNSNLLKEKKLYLNLWDLGQKIKIETIDSSIREISKGTTSNAVELLEYIIGSKKLSNEFYREFRNTEIKEKYLSDLDSSQQKAFLMATDGNPVSLIKGPPGTGKTHVIKTIINYLVKERKEKVLVSSQTHVAIDNVLDKIVTDSDMIIPKRITNRKNKYDTNHIDKTLFNIWNNNFQEFLQKTSDNDLSEEIIKDLNNFKGERSFAYSTKSGGVSVIGVTTTASQTAGKKGYSVLEDFDWLIIDEVSKCPITEVLRYLPYVKRIIMVGDDYQLAPLLEFSKEDVKDLDSFDEEKFDELEKIYQESVFASLYDKALKENRVVQLSDNYRSVKDVLNVYNVFYEDQLRNCRENINPNKVNFKNGVDNILNKSDVLFVEVKGGSELRDGTSRYNVQELEATKEYLIKILKEVENPEEVVVAAIFPYAAQIKRFVSGNRDLINEARETFKNFELDTVDAFQGKEADIVLVNTVVTDASRHNFLSDFRRINVALSRARDKLVIFGNSLVLKKIKMQINDKAAQNYFNDIIDYISYKVEGFIEYKGEGK